MKIFIDSNILIEYLRGNKKAYDFLSNISMIPDCQLCVGVMQKAEIIFFTKKNEENDVNEFLSNFKYANVDENIINIASSLYKKWKPSHGVDINDCILAATAKVISGTIYTLNIKHFPMKDIEVKKAW